MKTDFEKVHRGGLELFIQMFRINCCDSLMFSNYLLSSKSLKFRASDILCKKPLFYGFWTVKL